MALIPVKTAQTLPPPRVEVDEPVMYGVFPPSVMTIPQMRSPKNAMGTTTALQEGEPSAWAQKREESEARSRKPAVKRHVRLEVRGEHSLECKEVFEPLDADE